MLCGHLHQQSTTCGAAVLGFDLQSTPRRRSVDTPSTLHVSPKPLNNNTN
ncbi:hypothetical protein Scep_024762 [Stephania cephalantha]|uniref:Uncharacterized protein n=1 Tax=Stephania cephalantha TaxID=152367 RepID=A0AAP0F027_9MAGN